MEKELMNEDYVSPIPDELKCNRFGTKAFHNSELITAMKEKSPVTPYLDLFTDYLNALDSESFTGSAQQLFDALVKFEAFKTDQTKTINPKIRLQAFIRYLKMAEEEASWVTSVVINDKRLFTIYKNE